MAWNVQWGKSFRHDTSLPFYRRVPVALFQALSLDKPLESIINFSYLTADPDQQDYLHQIPRQTHTLEDYERTLKKIFLSKI